MCSTVFVLAGKLLLVKSMRPTPVDSEGQFQGDFLQCIDTPQAPLRFAITDDLPRNRQKLAIKASPLERCVDSGEVN